MARSAEASAKQRASKLRAGKRKCRRCKVVFYKPRGPHVLLCPRCKTHCSRCDVLLTVANKSTHSTKAYECLDCRKEIGFNTRSRDCAKIRQRERHLLTKYGITVNEYEAMLESQKGVCFICGNPPKKGGPRLHVDHLHSKGENKRNPREKRCRIRGLLCWHCNQAIGKFKDDVTRLRKAADYLETWPAQKILQKEKTNGT